MGTECGTDWGCAGTAGGTDLEICWGEQVGLGWRCDEGQQVELVSRCVGDTRLEWVGDVWGYSRWD